MRVRDDEFLLVPGPYRTEPAKWNNFFQLDVRGRLNERKYNMRGEVARARARALMKRGYVSCAWFAEGWLGFFLPVFVSND